jgi:hypothetical protein
VPAARFEIEVAFASRSHFHRKCRPRLYLDGMGSTRSTDLPDKLIFRIHVKPSRKKYFSFPEAQISRILRPSRFAQEGRFAIVTDVGSGMRWTRRLHRTSVAEADGEIVRS